MNDLNNKFSIRRVRCLFSYYSKQWKEGFLYLPLTYLSIGVLQIIHSVLIGNPKSIDNNDLSSFVNVTNFQDKAFGLLIFKVAFLVFLFFQLFSIITKKEKSTFFRSIPATSFEKFSFFMLEYLYFLLLMISIQIFCIFLDGMVCALLGYNEWSDILPAIKSYFTPELKINNGLVSFGFKDGKLLDDSWMTNGFLVWGVSFNRIMTYVFFMMSIFGLISIIRNPKVISQRKMKLLKNEAFVKTLSLIIGAFIFIAIFFLSSKISKQDLSITGFGPWCYNLEYGWMIQTFVLMIWSFFALRLIYKGIKYGEAK